MVIGSEQPGSVGVRLGFLTMSERAPPEQAILSEAWAEEILKGADEHA